MRPKTGTRERWRTKKGKGSVKAKTAQEARERLMRAVIMATFELIRDAGPAGVPAGDLYAVVAVTDMSVEGFAAMIGGMVDLGLVERSPSDVLTLGPRGIDQCVAAVTPRSAGEGS